MRIFDKLISEKAKKIIQLLEKKNGWRFQNGYVRYNINVVNIWTGNSLFVVFVDEVDVSDTFNFIDKYYIKKVSRKLRNRFQIEVLETI